MNDLQLELSEALVKIQGLEQNIPLLDKVYKPFEVDFRPMPAGMLDILLTSDDYGEIQPGAEPTWLAITSEAGTIKAVVYRTIDGSAYYVLGPKRPTLQ